MWIWILLLIAAAFALWTGCLGGNKVTGRFPLPVRRALYVACTAVILVLGAWFFANTIREMLSGHYPAGRLVARILALIGWLCIIGNTLRRKYKWTKALWNE